MLIRYLESGKEFKQHIRNYEYVMFAYSWKNLFTTIEVRGFIDCRHYSNIREKHVSSLYPMHWMIFNGDDIGAIM